MKRIFLIASVVVIGLITSPWLAAQSKAKQRVPARDYVEDLKLRPDFGIDYGQVAKFKVASRKTSYRTGEMISIDLAVMNASDAPVFFHKLERPSLGIKAHDVNGASVSINTYHTVLEGVTAQAYQRVEPGYILSDTFELLAGCESSGLKAYFDARQMLEEEEHRGGERVFFKGLFERDLFVNWGEACFAIKTPGKYTITAEQFNDTVVVSSLVPKVKTAVGTIRSTPLVITIID